MPDEFCVPDGNDFSDTGPDIVDSDSFDVTSDSSVDDLSDIMTDSVDTSAPVLDDDFYHATPNSDIPILQEDGSVASLEEVMAANAETDSGPLDEVEPYVATPNSDIPILQEDGSVASLEEIMAANAETDSGPLDEVEPYVATPNSDIPIHQEDGSVASLEEVMAANAETDSGPLDEVEPYVATPNSDIPIHQEDGSVASLEEVMAANAETDSGSLDEVDPYVATPNSDIPIHQEDGSVASLEEVMAADAETDSDALDEVDPYVATPNSDIPILQEDGSVASLEEIMTRNAETDSSLDSASSDSADNGDSTLLNDEADAIGDVNTETEGLPETVGEPIHMTQSDVEWYIENANDSESLRQMRDDIASGRIQVDADTEVPSDDSVDEASGPILTRDHNEQWEIGNHAIDDTIEAMRDDLRDKGMEDGPEMEAIVMTERARMQEELTRNINGDFSDPYQKPDFTELMQGNGVDTVDTSVQNIPTDVQEADTVEAADVVADVPQDIDYDAVYSGLDSYDFDGIDYSSDVDRLDSSLENFQDGAWENLSVDEQKAAMSDLADYVKDVIGFDNPPQIVYYNNPVDGDYGGYSPGTNTLEINEHMLYDNNEAADTIAHELWHAYQHERAMNPQSAKDYQYQYGFENYIRPDDDFTAYQDQLVEAEARAFAQQFKDRLSTKRRSI